MWKWGHPSWLALRTRLLRICSNFWTYKIKTWACQVYSQKILYSPESLSSCQSRIYNMNHASSEDNASSCLLPDTNECRPLIGCSDSAMASDWSSSRHPLISSYCASRHCFRLITCDLYIHNGHHDKQISSGVFRVFMFTKNLLHITIRGDRGQRKRNIWYPSVKCLKNGWGGNADHIDQQI